MGFGKGCWSEIVGWRGWCNSDFFCNLKFDFWILILISLEFFILICVEVVRSFGMLWSFISGLCIECVFLYVFSSICLGLWVYGIE